MTKTQYYAASSLDGFIAGPRHSLEWLLVFAELRYEVPALRTS